MYFTLSLLALFFSQALAQFGNGTVRRCPEDLAPPESTKQITRMLAVQQAEDLNVTLAALESTLNVNLYIHILSNGAEGNITQNLVDAQLAVLSAAYESHGISFTLQGTTRTNNAAWFNMEYNSTADTEMKASLRQGTFADLNVYIGNPYDSIGPLLGYSTFPVQADLLTNETLTKDGVYIHYQSVPGGGYDPYDEGDTLVHESGHWFNLLHTYQGRSCSGEGDLVADTPQESALNTQCKTRDSCIGSKYPGSDPIHNYMDYTPDACMTEFTVGQETRIYTSWDEFRAQWVA